MKMSQMAKKFDEIVSCYKTDADKIIILKATER